VLIQGEIDRQKATNITFELLALQAEKCRDRDETPLAIIINSPGGKVDPGRQIYDAVKSASCEIHGIVFGEASSTASVILQACHRRFTLPHGQSLVHHVTSDKTVRFDSRRVEKSAQVYARHALEYAKAWDEVLAEVMDMGSYDYISLTAPEMLRLGFVDEILPKVNLFKPYSPPAHPKRRGRAK